MQKKKEGNSHSLKHKEYMGKKKKILHLPIPIFFPTQKLLYPSTPKHWSEGTHAHTSKGKTAKGETHDSNTKENEMAKQKGRGIRSFVHSIIHIDNSQTTAVKEIHHRPLNSRNGSGAELKA